jgi:hypothetical protein
VFVCYFYRLLIAAVSNGSSVAWNAWMNCSLYGRSLLRYCAVRAGRAEENKEKVSLLVSWHIRGQDICIRQKRYRLKQFAQMYDYCLGYLTNKRQALLSFVRSNSPTRVLDRLIVEVSTRRSHTDAYPVGLL